MTEVELAEVISLLHGLLKASPQEIVYLTPKIVRFDADLVRQVIDKYITQIGKLSIKEFLTELQYCHSRRYPAAPERAKERREEAQIKALLNKIDDEYASETRDMSPSELTSWKLKALNESGPKGFAARQHLDPSKSQSLREQMLAVIKRSRGTPLLNT